MLICSIHKLLVNKGEWGRCLQSPARGSSLHPVQIPKRIATGYNRFLIHDAILYLIVRDRIEIASEGKKIVEGVAAPTSVCVTCAKHAELVAERSSGCNSLIISSVKYPSLNISDWMVT